MQTLSPSSRRPTSGIYGLRISRLPRRKLPQEQEDSSRPVAVGLRLQFFHPIDVLTPAAREERKGEIYEGMGKKPPEKGREYRQLWEERQEGSVILRLRNQLTRFLSGYLQGQAKERKERELSLGRNVSSGRIGCALTALS